VATNTIQQQAIQITASSQGQPLRIYQKIGFVLSVGLPKPSLNQPSSIKHFSSEATIVNSKFDSRTGKQEDEEE
jgi:hypothetical protein